MGMGCSSVGLSIGLSCHWCRFDSPMRQGIFFSVNFQCWLPFHVHTLLCAITYINIFAHDKDPVVHVRVRWIMARQTYPARTISDKNNQLDDCGHSSAMSMLLQHGHIHAPQTVIIIKILHDAICAQLALGTKLSIDKPLAVPQGDMTLSRDHPHGWSILT